RDHRRADRRLRAHLPALRAAAAGARAHRPPGHLRPGRPVPGGGAAAGGDGHSAAVLAVVAEPAGRAGGDAGARRFLRGAERAARAALVHPAAGRGRTGAGFLVLAPAAEPLLVGGRWITGAVNAIVNLLILLLVWAVVRYGLAATLWWGMSRVGTELGASLVRLIRFLPLLLIFSIALFYSAEVWQVFDHTPGVSDVILGAFFAALILLILSMRLRAETHELLTRAEAEHPPAADLPPLTRAQELNVTAMVGANQLLQVIVVSAGVGVFFFALGVLTITPGVL